MKLAVVGSRGWKDYRAVAWVLHELHPDEIVSGGAAGADKLAEHWASIYDVPIKIFRPDWAIGRRGAAIRNQQIVDYCDQLVAFWDGKSRGTKMSIDMAAKAGKLLRIIRQ